MYYFYDLCQFFFFNDTATTEIYTLSLHDALPIYRLVMGVEQNQKRFVADRLADAVHIVERAAVQFETDTAHPARVRSEEHTSELQSRPHLVCRLLLEKKKQQQKQKK